MNDYRTPTPATLKGARTVTTPEATVLWREKAAVFVDVMPQAPRPANLPAGTIWRDRPRLSVPGTTWLPDTGYGAVSGATDCWSATDPPAAAFSRSMVCSIACSAGETGAGAKVAAELPGLCPSMASDVQDDAASSSARAASPVAVRRRHCSPAAVIQLGSLRHHG